MGLTFKKSQKLDVVAFGDANYGNGRSQTGVVTKMGGNSIAWRSCKQNATATSSADSEVQAMQLTVVLGETIRLLMESILQPISCMELMCDNKATITYASCEGTWKPRT